MAEAKHSGSSKNFGKVLQKTVFRTKEKVLQNLGKADKTSDEQFDIFVNNFTKQQAAACKLQKELKNYVACVRSMAMASKTFYDTLRDMYEEEWTGHSDITGAAEALSAIWEDYIIKLTNQVQEPVGAYVSRFPEMKHKISKRNRKMMDYDGTRHTLDSLNNQKKKDEIKIQKATTEMTSAKAIYDEISTELHSELPSLYENRKSTLSNILNSLFSSEGKFQEESAKIKNTLADATERLNRESSDVFFKQYNSSPLDHNVRDRVSSSSSTPPKENKLKAANIPQDRISNRSNKSSHGSPSTHSDKGSRNGSVSCEPAVSGGPARTEENSYVMDTSAFSSPSPGKTNGEVTSKDAPPDSPSPLYPRLASQEDDAYENIMVDSQTTDRTLVNDDSIDDKRSSRKQDEDDEDQVTPSTPKQTVGSGLELTNNNESKVDSDSEEERPPQESVYSVAQGTDDTYSVPINNQPVDPLPNNVLYQVQATHPYTGDDIDELTFDVGDMINVIEFEDPEDQDDGWLMGIKIVSGEKGVFPENFTKKV